MTDNDTRLERIEQRVKGLGFQWFCWPGSFQIRMRKDKGLSALYFAGDCRVPDDIAAAEALLSLCEPAPVLEIRQDEGGHCKVFCDFWGLCPFGCKATLVNNEGDYYYKPGAECPGPAPDDKEYVLVLRSKVDGNDTI